jgi:disulfide bond formation protein DsbB
MFGGLAAVSLGMLAGALILGGLFRLRPCYWCNFQRLLCMILAFWGICGVLLPKWRRVWAPLLALTALGGVLAAGWQSWMQYAPQDTIECGFGDPTLIERLVDWLGGLWPSMFMVTGMCKELDWAFLGLSLANWSGVSFFALFCAALWTLFRRNRG